MSSLLTCKYLLPGLYFSFKDDFKIEIEILKSINSYKNSISISLILISELKPLIISHADSSRFVLSIIPYAHVTASSLISWLFIQSPKSIKPTILGFFRFSETIMLLSFRSLCIRFFLNPSYSDSFFLKFRRRFSIISWRFLPISIFL